MLKLLIIPIVIIIALLQGGSLQRFATLELRWLSLVFGSLVLQLLIFTPFRNVALITTAVPWLHIASMLLLVGWLLLNRHIPGLIWMAAGLLCNLIAISANQGYMPVTAEALRSASIVIPFDAAGIYHNSVLLPAEQTRLWLLTDILPIPYAGVYSIGDVLLTFGIAQACYRTIRPASTLAQASA